MGNQQLDRPQAPAEANQLMPHKHTTSLTPAAPMPLLKRVSPRRVTLRVLTKLRQATGSSRSKSAHAT